jgi:hypothetical protein
LRMGSRGHRWGLQRAWLCRARLHCFLAIGFWVFLQQHARRRERERGIVSLKRHCSVFSFYFICGVPINRLQQVYCEKLRSGTKNQALPENTYNYNFQSMKRIAQIDKAYWM